MCFDLRKEMLHPPHPHPPHPDDSAYLSGPGDGQLAFHGQALLGGVLDDGHQLLLLLVHFTVLKHTTVALYTLWTTFSWDFTPSFQGFQTIFSVISDHFLGLLDHLFRDFRHLFRDFRPPFQRSLYHLFTACRPSFQGFHNIFSGILEHLFSDFRPSFQGF